MENHKRQNKSRKAIPTSERDKENFIFPICKKNNYQQKQKNNGNRGSSKPQIQCRRRDTENIILSIPHKKNYQQEQKNSDKYESLKLKMQYRIQEDCNQNESLFNNGDLVKNLEDLSKKSSKEILMLIAQHEQEFRKFLDEDMDPNVFVVTLRLVKNICQANFTELMVKTLSLTLSTNFLKTLENYLTKLPFESDAEKTENEYYHEDINRFWNDLIEFLKKIIELLPCTASDKMIVLLQQAYLILSNIENAQKYTIDAVIKENVMGMMNDLKNEFEQIDGNSIERNKTDFGPPENFRMLSTIPTNEDLSDYRPYLRPCKIKEQYDSVEHYLDVQFRLLKEDFVRPLRNGIREYLGEQRNQTMNRRNNDLRIYKNSKLMGFKIINESAGLQLYFGKLKHVDWFNSERLIFGSLLLLSKDDFKTIYFVTVTNCDRINLQNGYVTVTPCVGTLITPDLCNCNLVMLESKIFFEPYYQVMCAMKNINNANFPMDSYFIRAETIVKLPRYLREKLLDTKKLIFRETISLPINDLENWPTAKELNFDESQLSAFKSALTQEFAIVQGPPGTGKTYLALQVVGALLENRTLWRRYGPIVIVCLTNHALDSFLEGILASTESIVRLGSRSKNENLKQFTLVERRKGFHSESNMYRISIKQELKSILETIKITNSLLELLKTPDIIVPLKCLQSRYNEFPLNTFSHTKELIHWLIDDEIIYLMNTFTEINNENHNNWSIEQSDDMFTDEDFVLDYERPSTIVTKGDLNILNLLNREIEFVTNVITELVMLSSPFSITSQWQEYLQMLLEKQSILQYEFSLHPLINKSSQKSNNYRWQKYRQWVQQSYEHLNDQKHKLEQKYYEVNSRLYEATQLSNLSVLKEHDIIGLTTTCAAKLQSSLRALKAPIVLVEEAAEILESHVVCSLTEHCQQVILIGDHKQLKPKASVYELGKNYNLNVSLFERMVDIRGDCEQLAYQHRMRPQIARLIRPAIYEKLYDHEAVLNYPDVMGLTNNVFFINHQNREHYKDNDHSCANQHEVKFLSAFAKHLILQGYGPQEITILCTYTRQLFDFMNETKYHPLLKHVRVTTVDNFQGEENRIILLSLVRNNGEGKIGFLKEENRVCVALSRAREGLYIMGNMKDLLVGNDVWPQIKKVLEKDNAIGDSLTVKCQVHAEQIFQMKNAEDFVQCPKGGCMLNCDSLLSCGHNCTSICHIIDREHQKYRCRKPCNRTCPNNHPCLLLCEEECEPCEVPVERTLECGHTVLTPCSEDPDTFECLVEVEVILPGCNHKVTKCCYLPIDECLCDYDCNIRLECGHKCARKCHTHDDPDHLKYECLEDCTKKNLDCLDHMCEKRCHEECEPCSVRVLKMRSCGHENMIKCSEDVETYYCPRPCERGKLDCGHKCMLKCGDDCKNCQTKVEKESSCGHIIKVKCCEEATPALCYKKCSIMLPCGHPCANMCKDDCTVDCQVLVQIDKIGLCGHPAWIPCCMKHTDPKSLEFVKYCKEPCKIELACGHLCKGNCGQCFQGRLHVACREPCRHIFICGHPCQLLCNQECRPCNRRCEMKCQHNQCNKICGEPCEPCQNPCLMKCEHQACTKKCHELCDIKPCEEPCKIMLKCNHPCIGFCGDPCPPLCRICDVEKVTVIFPENENKPNSRFVLLPDCGHVIESKGLLLSITNSTSDGTVTIKTPTCPKCSTNITTCQRLMNHVKESFKYITAVRSQFFCEYERNLIQKQRAYYYKFENIKKERIYSRSEASKCYLQYLRKLDNILKKSKIQILSNNNIYAFENILDILNELLFLLKQKRNNHKRFEFVINQIRFVLESLPNELLISKQRLEDIYVELRRFHVMIKVSSLFSNAALLRIDEKKWNHLVEKLTSIERFTDTHEKEIIENFSNLDKIITLETRRKTVKEVASMIAGSWYKCPNNHFYVCLPTQSAACFECNTRVKK